MHKKKKDFHQGTEVLFPLYYMFSYSPVQPMLCKIVKDANERIT